jgi:hypothetical protein
MAVEAIGGYMRSDQGKTASLMNFSDVIYDPGNRRVAPGAIRSYCLVVDISVTGNTFFSGFRKFQGGMT